MIELKEIVSKLNNILSKNDLTLIDEFENEFVKIANEFNDKRMILYGNGQLIRKSYYLIISIYGKNSTLEHFRTLINDTNGKGRKMVMEFSRIKNSDFKLQKENEEIICWILNDYYGGLSGYRSSTKSYQYCYPTRYLIDKMVDFINIENNVFDNFQNKIIKIEEFTNNTETEFNDDFDDLIFN